MRCGNPGSKPLLRQHGVRAAAAAAEQFLMLLEGALLLSRARHHCQPLRQPRATFLKTLEVSP